MKTIITPEEVGQLSRPVSTDLKMLESIIREAESEDIRPRLGDSLYIAVTEDETEERFATFLSGGQWTDSKGGKRFVSGLKKAAAYFVYARVIRDANIQATRYGATIKQDDYSSAAIAAERRRQYDEAFSLADRYLKDCLVYLYANKATFPEYCLRGEMRNNRTTFRILGEGMDVVPTFGSSKKKDSPIIVDGQDGDSAYEVAVKNGYRGTQEEWLASLKGEQGAPLTWDDLTEEQKIDLIRPFIDAFAHFLGMDSWNTDWSEGFGSATLPEQMRNVYDHLERDEADIETLKIEVIALKKAIRI